MPACSLAAASAAQPARGCFGDFDDDAEADDDAGAELLMQQAQLRQQARGNGGAFVLCHLAGQPPVPCPPEPRSAPHYQVLLDRLVEREEVLASAGGEGEREGALVTADVDDVAFLVREVWRGVSAVELCSISSSSSKLPSVPGGECGLATATSKLTLCRWRREQQRQEQGSTSSSSPSPSPSAASVDNLVLLTFAEAEAHERGELIGKLDKGVAERIERALERVRREF